MFFKSLSQILLKKSFGEVVFQILVQDFIFAKQSSFFGRHSVCYMVALGVNAIRRLNAIWS